VRISLTTSELDLQERNDSRVFGKVRRELTEGAADLLEVARANAGTPPPDPAFTSGEVVLISYTSGTSGMPKGATNTYGNIATSAAALSGFSGLAEGCALFGLPPLFHITGMVCEVRDGHRRHACAHLPVRAGCGPPRSSRASPFTR
jgi:long-chain acyl-CoA synthetase